MADHHQQITQQPHQYHTDNFKNYFHENGHSKSKVLAVVTLLPVGGTLLLLAGLSLIGTLIGIAIATPVFLIFSPILVPAALLITGSIAGFLTSGAFGITGLSSLSWIANFLRGTRGFYDSSNTRPGKAERAGHRRTVGPEDEGCGPKDPE